MAQAQHEVRPGFTQATRKATQQPSVPKTQTSQGHYALRETVKPSRARPSQAAAYIAALIFDQHLLRLMENEVQVWPIRNAAQVRRRREGGRPEPTGAVAHVVIMENVWR